MLGVDEFLAKTKPAKDYNLVVQRTEDGFLRLTNQHTWEQAQRIQKDYYRLIAQWDSKVKGWKLEEGLKEAQDADTDRIQLRNQRAASKGSRQNKRAKRIKKPKARPGKSKM